MGRRWEVHINEEKDNGIRLLDCSNTIANLIKSMVDRLTRHKETTLILPPNIPGGHKHASLPVLYDDEEIDLNPQGYLDGWDGE